MQQRWQDDDAGFVPKAQKQSDSSTEAAVLQSAAIAEPPAKPTPESAAGHSVALVEPGIESAPSKVTEPASSVNTVCSLSGDIPLQPESALPENEQPRVKADPPASFEPAAHAEPPSKPTDDSAAGHSMSFV